MAQLTRLNLSGTPAVHRRQLRCERVLATAGKCADDVGCCGLERLRAGLERVVGVL
jgi:hypothetical protein